MNEAIAAQKKAVDSLLQIADESSAALTTSSSATVFDLAVLTVVSLAGTIALSLVIGLGGLAQPLTRLNEAMVRISRNDFALEVPGAGRGDEIGAMARTVDVFKAAGQDVERLRAEQERVKTEAERAQRAAMNRTADQFEQRVGGLAGALSQAAEKLRTTAQGMTATAGETNDQASSGGGGGRGSG